MKKSKYASILKIDKDVYALYNNLVMKPVFVRKEMLEKIEKKELTSEEQNILNKIGYFIEDFNIDDQILSTYKQIFKSELENRISLMYIIPTNSCNLGCKYCFIGKLEKKDISMTSDILLKAIDLFAQELNGNEGTILFYGGEPLMNFDMLKLAVNYVSYNNMNIRFSMVTNGTLINTDIAEFIKENNISVGVSIDGPKKVNDQNRVYKNSDIGSYDKVFEKIRILQSRNVNFGLSITLSKETLEHQQEFFDWLRELNVKSISYNLLHFTEKDPDFKQYYRDATKFICKSNDKLYDEGFDEDRIKRKYDAFYNRKFKFADCAAIGGNQIALLPNGDIEVCHGLWNRKREHILNIKNVKSFDEIKKTKEYKFWKNNLTLKKEKCLKCPAIYVCGGGCAVQSKDLFGDINGIDEGFCIHTTIILKLILKEVYNESINN